MVWQDDVEPSLGVMVCLGIMPSDQSIHGARSMLDNRYEGSVGSEHLQKAVSPSDATRKSKRFLFLLDMFNDVASDLMKESLMLLSPCCLSIYSLDYSSGRSTRRRMKLIMQVPAPEFLSAQNVERRSDDDIPPCCE